MSRQFPETFADWIAPMTAEQFFAESNSHQPVKIERSGFDSGRPLLGLDEMLAHLACIPLDPQRDKPPFKLARDTKTIPDVFLAARAEEPIESWILPLFEQGWSVIADFVDLRCAPIETMAAFLSEALSSDVWVNLYYTPKSARTLRFHADSHDVFIWQQIGRKSWKIWPRGAAETDEPLIDTTLGPNEILYIPENFPHLAESGTDEPSLHLTCAFRSRAKRLKQHLRSRLARWEEPEFESGSAQIDADALLDAGSQFLAWLATDTTSHVVADQLNGPASVGPSQAAAILRDLDRLDADSEIRLNEKAQDFVLKHHLRYALGSCEAFRPSELNLEVSAALHLGRVLINAGAAKIQTRKSSA